MLGRRHSRQILPCVVQCCDTYSSPNQENLRALQEFGAKGSFIQYGGVVDHALIVRGITTVYNIDYITDVVFHLNGAIKVT